MAEGDGSRDAAAWLAHATRQDGDAVRADARLANALDTDRSVLRVALATGRMSVVQAQVIVRVLDDLPVDLIDLDPEMLGKAEQVMVDYALDYTPATWTEAHHLRPWSQAGPTDLSNAVSLCCFHHHRAHDPDYTKTRLPNGDLRFHRRT